MTDLFTRGKMSAAAAIELAGGVLHDHAIPHEAIKAFASLGANGRHLQNGERDLHRWMRTLYGFQLEPYTILLGLQVDNQQVQQVPTQVILPHELLHSIATMEQKLFFSSVMLGNWSDAAREEFWLYVKTLPPWANHPVLSADQCDFRRLIGFTIHGDGAVMKRDDECFTWSVSSCFSQDGLIKDPLHVKFPVAIVPERYMLTKRVPSQ